MSKVARKPAFVEALRRSLGIVEPALKAVGIERQTYYNWRERDPAFAEACDRVTEEQIDFAESQLLKLIKEGNPTAIIFYLKTKGKKRGYTERGDAGIAKPAEQPKVISQTVLVNIEAHRQNIIRILEGEGKYTAELSNQVDIAAQLEVRRDIIAKEMFSPDYKPINTEYSREGSVRQSVNPMETLYLDICSQLQRVYKGLGMNTDSKERASDGEDTSADFLSKHKIE